MKRPQLTSNRSVLRIAAVAAVLMLSLSISSQEKVRVVDQGKRYDNTPLVVLSCSVGKVEFPECRDVRGDTDWWTQLKFSVKNVSKKTISQLNVNIYVEKRGEMRAGLMMNVMASVPIRMIADERGWPSGRYGIRIAPGEVFEMSVGSAEIKNWQRHLGQYNVSDLAGFKFDVRGVYFDDGTYWFYGTERRIDAGQSVDPTRKLIKAGYKEKNEPVEIVGLRADGLAIALDVPFKGGDEWLRDLTILFKNVSGRTILSVEFSFAFLASFPTAANRGDSLVYGLSPKQREWDMAKMRVLKPDGQDEVKMDNVHYERLKAFLGYQEDLATRTTAELRVGFVSFADGTRWQYGSYYKPDPSKPGEFIREK